MRASHVEYGHISCSFFSKCLILTRSSLGNVDLECILSLWYLLTLLAPRISSYLVYNLKCPGKVSQIWLRQSLHKIITMLWLGILAYQLKLCRNRLEEIYINFNIFCIIFPKAFNASRGDKVIIYQTTGKTFLPTIIS